MKKIGILVFICLMLSACAVGTKKFSNNKNTEYMAMLSDPAIRKDFRQLKAIAMSAELYTIDHRIYFSKEDIVKLDAISAVLINRLRYEYHLKAGHYRIHTFIGKYQAHSCYQYYNSYATNEIGKACYDFSHQFGSCQLCDNYLKAIHSRKLGIMHATWWNNENTIDLVDLFKLKNGDAVYMGLEVSIS
jgi:hypothetical protein